jgi:hypothetical protein
MNCDKERVTHWLNNELTEAERHEFGAHLAGCTACQQEIKEAREVLTLMKQIQAPEPSPGMEVRFQGMLDAYKQSVIKEPDVWKNFTTRLRQLWYFQPKLQLSYSIVLLLLGMAVGYLFLNKSPKDNSKEQIATLSSQVEDMRQMMMLSLLENPSASERLRAVSYTEEITKVNEQIIDALLRTLNEDPNVNVRLVTLEALIKYSDHPGVREELIRSIAIQESPLLQSALADLMIRLQEKRSVSAFKQLLNNTGPGNPVKPKIEKTITQLSL